MDLRKAAAYFEGTTFDSYDETLDSWTLNAFTAKLAPVDRFLSNFDRPTHRRMLGVAPGVSLPADNTIRVQSTQDVYILGQVRADDKNNTEYDRIGIAHLVYNQFTINRKSPVGPASDPGPLINSVIGFHYGGLEFRSDSVAPEQHEGYEGEFFIILPPHADVQEWDFIYHGSDTYQVKSTYTDSGFIFARAVQRVDYRKEFTYHHKGDTAGYDASTGTVTSGLVDYQVSGFARNISEDEFEYATTKDKSMKIVIRKDHIGIVPKTDDQLTWEGITYNVSIVRQDPADEEYQLYCSL